MKTLIINAHPTPQQSQTQSFFKETVQSLENVRYVELINETITLEQLLEYNRIIFQFPVYWYSAPAILKHWIDETFLSNEKRLAGIELGVVPVFGALQSHYQSGGKEKYTPSEMLRPFEMLANHLGMVYLTPFSVFQFEFMSHEQRQVLLVDYWMYVCGIKTPSFKQKGDFLLALLKNSQVSEHVVNLIEEQRNEIEELELIVGEME